MPWRAGSVMDERVRFVAERLAGEVTMAELCAAYGISRKTGYKWLQRYLADGAAGLAERSHAPLRPGRVTPPALAEKIVEQRQARPHWGPRKIVAKLAQLHPELAWPSHATAGAILKRAGLVDARRRRRRVPLRPGDLVVPERPNQVWAVDHKGWVRLKDGTRCEPFTVTDGYSRFLIALAPTGSTRAAEVRAVLERAFAEYGLPEMIRSDNGPPFASASPTALSALSVWWARLGIRHERIRPGKPQENGRHERFHRTLLEAMRPTAADRQAQSVRFAAFRRDYNEERPHEALGQIAPAAFYKPSTRSLPAKLPEPDYPPMMTLRRVRTSGEIKWRGRLVMVSTALAGDTVALEETAAGWRLWFYRSPIGLLATGSRTVSPIIPG